MSIGSRQYDESSRDPNSPGVENRVQQIKFLRRLQSVNNESPGSTDLWLHCDAHLALIKKAVRVSVRKDTRSKEIAWRRLS